MNHKKRNTIGRVLTAVTLAVSLSLTAAFSAAPAMGVQAVSQSKVNEIKSIIHENYYFRNKISDRKLDAAARKADPYHEMVKTLDDRWSHYLTKEEYKKEMDDFDGKQGAGLGISYSASDFANGAHVLKTHAGGGAEAAGLRAGDYITAIDGTSVVGKDAEMFSKLARGKKGTVANVAAIRNGQAFNVSVTRKPYKTHSTEGVILPDGTAWVEIESFDNDTATELEKITDNAKKKGMKRLVIDLRNNGGGLITSAETCFDDIIDKQVTLFTTKTSKNKKNDKNDYDEKHTSFVSINREHYIDCPIAVLVSKNTASAAELFAGAFKDLKLGKVVGQTTYGKGVGQTYYELSDGSGLKLTNFAYYLPKGECIHGKGVTPNVRTVPDTSIHETRMGYNPADDPEVQTAIRLMK